MNKRKTGLEVDSTGVLVTYELAEFAIPKDAIEPLFEKHGVDVDEIRYSTKWDAYDRAFTKALEALNKIESDITVSYKMVAVGYGTDKEKHLIKITADPESKKVEAETSIGRYKFDGNDIVVLTDEMGYSEILREQFAWECDNITMMHGGRHIIRRTVENLVGNTRLSKSRPFFWCPLDAVAIVNGKTMTNADVLNNIKALFDDINKNYLTSVRSKNTLFRTPILSADSGDLHDTVEQALIDEANILANKRWNEIKNWGDKRVTQKQLDNWTRELAQIEKWREQVSTTLQRPMDEVNVASIKARDAYLKLNIKFTEQQANKK